MAISKKTREAVYQKYAGHCAYCGRPIAYKDMQVDKTYFELEEKRFETFTSQQSLFY